MIRFISLLCLVTFLPESEKASSPSSSPDPIASELGVRARPDGGPGDLFGSNEMLPSNELRGRLPDGGSEDVSIEDDNMCWRSC